MIAQADRTQFETRAHAGANLRNVRALAVSLSNLGGPHALRAFAALALHAAAAAPERLAFVYDEAAGVWLGAPVAGAPVDLEPGPLAPIPPAFWNAFWALVEDPRAGGVVGDLAARAGALVDLAAPGVRRRAARTALAYAGVREAAAGYPRRFTRRDLGRCPEGSLGAALLSAILRHGPDLGEVDREAAFLRLPAPLACLAAHMAQGHELWRLTAGYATTRLHDLALAAFQAGQFGRQEAALALACALAKVAFGAPAGANVVLDVVFSGWKHGRESPPLLRLDWESLWDLPAEGVRAACGVAPFASPWPADLFEQFEAATA